MARFGLPDLVMDIQYRVLLRYDKAQVLDLVSPCERTFPPERGFQGFPRHLDLADPGDDRIPGEMPFKDPVRGIQPHGDLQVPGTGNGWIRVRPLTGKDMEKVSFKHQQWFVPGVGKGQKYRKMMRERQAGGGHFWRASFITIWIMGVLTVTKSGNPSR